MWHPFFQNKEERMAQERLSMRNICEILRLNDARLSNLVIARACRISNSTVGEYLQRAQQMGIRWPLPEGLSEEALYQILFPENSTPAEAARPLPDWHALSDTFSINIMPSLLKAFVLGKSWKR
jgi:hypothetical protein